MSEKTTNQQSLQLFQQYLLEIKPLLKQNYEQLLAHDLSRQQWQSCFQRNVVAVLAQAYQLALTKLQSLSFDGNDMLIEKGLSSLTKAVLAVFDGFSDEFLSFVVNKHRTSCALSNFPDEHKPDADYVNEVKKDIAGLWQEFALQTNDYFLSCRL